jgi:hypothetical protein
MMAKSYRRVANSGPVPYPSDPRKLLVDEIVTGDEWEPLVMLGFVEEVEGVKGGQEQPPPRKKRGRPPKKKEEPAPQPAPEPKAEQPAEEALPPAPAAMDVVASAMEAAKKKSPDTSEGEVNELRTPDVGTGDQEVDPEAAG